MVITDREQGRQRRGAPWTEEEELRLIAIAHLPPRAIADMMRRSWLACRRRLIYLRANWIEQPGKDTTYRQRDAIIVKEVSVNLYELKIGDRVKTIDGAIAEIVKESADGRWILVRYIESGQNPDLVGTEDLCDETELAEMVST